MNRVAPTQPDGFSITRGFPESLRPAVASLYDAAFGPKIAVAIPDRSRRLTLLAEALDPTHALVALSGPLVLGVAGFKTPTGGLTSGITPRLLGARLGPLGALRAAAILPLFERRLRPGELLMDGIAVDAAARGSGVGTRLLQRLQQLAAEQGYLTIRLDVIDTNDRARRLYERLGFVATKTSRFPYLRWLLGFGAATTLEFRVAARGDRG